MPYRNVQSSSFEIFPAADQSSDVPISILFGNSPNAGDHPDTLSGSRREYAHGYSVKKILVAVAAFGLIFADRSSRWVVVEICTRDQRRPRCSECLSDRVDKLGQTLAA